MVSIDGTHIKASANKKKYQKEQVAKAARVYAKRLREEVNAERGRSWGNRRVEEEDEDDNAPPDGGTERTNSVDHRPGHAGCTVKGEHERQFAYEAHTACDKRRGMCWEWR